MEDKIYLKNRNGGLWDAKFTNCYDELINDIKALKKNKITQKSSCCITLHQELL